MSKETLKTRQTNKFLLLIGISAEKIKRETQRAFISFLYLKKKNNNNKCVYINKVAELSRKYYEQTLEDKASIPLCITTQQAQHTAI